MLRSTRFLAKSKIWRIIASGDDGVEETLLSIPNRKVKLYSADGTAWETVWESRTLPGYKRLKIYLKSFLLLKYLD